MAKSLLNGSFCHRLEQSLPSLKPPMTKISGIFYLILYLLIITHLCFICQVCICWAILVAMSKKVTRLYERFQPENYELSFDLDPKAMVFSGQVTVKGKKAGRPSERLTFHQKELKITKATVIKHDKKGDKTIEVVRINNQDSLDEVRLHAGEQLFPGNYTVTMEFESKITKPMEGIYPCFFKHDGQDKKLIATPVREPPRPRSFPLCRRTGG